MDNVIRFYNEGFFGYAPEKDFYLFSFWHFLPIILMIAAIVLIAVFKDKLKNYKHEDKIRYTFAFVMMMVEMSYFWRILYVGDSWYENKDLLTMLPLQICQWGLIVCIFTMMTKSRTLFGINFYLTLLFATVAVVYPMVISQTGPRYYRYYQFWAEHALPIIGTFYMMFVHGFKPQYKHLYYTFFVLAPLTVAALIANSTIENADYLYLNTEVPFLPESMFIRVPILVGVVVILFHLMYFGFKFIDKKITEKDKNPSA